MHPEIMNKLLSLALLVGGFLLIVYGVSAANSPASDLSRVATGSPTGNTTWLLIGGVAAACLGAFGLFRKTKAP